ncbi:MAG: TonB-dependent receptor [Mediterranea sp.]|jgi:TonB-linked SusC/RagA family outer membrane protein|nr:TonB-dependent receptor [Mediterranea sp.]
MINNRLLKTILFVIVASVSTVCSAIDSYSQTARLTLRGDEMTIKQALAEIEKQSEFIFFYHGEAVDTQRKVSIDMENQSIEQVLAELLKDTGSTYTISGRQVYISRKAEPKTDTKASVSQQPRTQAVTGTVVDHTGEPLIGVTVRLKGSNTGVVTDIDGRFSINANAGSVLLFTYVGYADQEVTLGQQRTLRVQMREDNAMLEEVLVTAYGTSTRAAFTGSAGIVNNKAIEQKQVTNVMDALKGAVAGVQVFKSGGEPDASPSFLIRGLTSINASNEPLIILDGAPFDAGWNNINPNDVESVTVLKDAASNALYGARGAGGVIMVTTKKASKYATTVTLDARFGVNKRIKNTYETIEEPGQYYEMQYKALNNYYIDQNNTPFDAYVKANNALTGSSAGGGLGYIVYDFPQGEYLIGQNGRLNPNATLGRIVSYNGEEYLLLPDDWYDAAFRESLRQEYNVSVSGGGEKGTYYTSFGYLNNEGIAYNTGYERFTGKVSVSYNANSWLTLGGNVNYSHSVRDGISTGYSASLFDFANSFAPIYPLYIRHADGSFYTDARGTMYDYGNGMNGGMSWPRSAWQNNNPIQTNLVDYRRAVGNSVTGQLYADIRFLKDFKFTINANLTFNGIRAVTATSPWYGYNKASGGYSGVSDGRTYSANIQQLLNWTRTFNDKHNASVLLGHEYYNTIYEYLSGTKTVAANYEHNKELSGFLVNGDPNSYYSEDYNSEGWFMRALYDYDGKYYGSFSFRRDGSSNFDPSRAWGNFWSLGGSWLINKEKWFDVEWVDMLKIKASYGQQGNDGIGQWRYVNQYTLADSNGQVAFNLSYYGNREISWETNGNFNAGVEFDLFKKRISGSVEYFHRKTGNMLTYFSVTPSVGYDGYYANIGNMNNSGVEVTLNGIVLRTRDLEWGVNLNMTHYRNKVTKLADQRKTQSFDGHPGYVSGSYIIAEGLPRYQWYLKQYAGVNEVGKALYYYTDDAGEKQTTTLWSDADYYLSGTPTPDLYGGFGTNFNWKGFDLAASFSYQIGGLAYDYGYSGLMGSPQPDQGGGNFHVDLLNAWSTENTSSNIPRVVFSDLETTRASDRWLTNASYLSMDNITVGYTLPINLIKKTGLKSVRFSVTCDNVFFVSKRQGFNPRTSWSGEMASTQTSPYTPMRTISGGLRVQF